MVYKPAPSKDYRSSHLSLKKSERYEEDIYRKGSYDDILWQEEKTALLKEVQALQKAVRNINYLDFACGTGRIIGFLETQVQSATGVDVSEAMLDVAKTKVKKGTLILADITKRDVLKGKSFELITAFRFFLNAEPPLRDAAMQTLIRKLQDRKGVFIFNVHGNMFSHRFMTKIWFWLKGRRLNALSYWQGKKITKKHGLHIVRWHGFGVVPKVCYRYINSRFLLAVDRFFFLFPFSKYISYNLIFICKKL